MWFGPSAAAGAVRMLADASPACGMGVSVATDGTRYQTEVSAASHSPAARSALEVHASAHGYGYGYGRRSPASVSSAGHGSVYSSSHGHGHGHGKEGARRPRDARMGGSPRLAPARYPLGLDGVNRVYYETIRDALHLPPVIADGRPSSSYCVGVQGDGLLYLDPHHSGPAVPLRSFVPTPSTSASNHDSTRNGAHAPATRRSLCSEAYARGGSMRLEGYARAGSMSSEFVSGRGYGHPPMAEDGLVYIPPCAPRTPHRTRTTPHPLMRRRSQAGIARLRRRRTSRARTARRSDVPSTASVRPRCRCPGSTRACSWGLYVRMGRNG
ncbi:hypothetical protein B0H17DRAFT_99980 [Mycena rosella]|uniref:Cysteine protease n=1 Tax=Mycena rosella TaxID=1033263 RepID=A0AAD7D6D1_MYCRO|nr:hypothetical protein B0H17DRAFT_99980 [Mycena rosella]